MPSGGVRGLLYGCKLVRVGAPLFRHTLTRLPQSATARQEIIFKQAHCRGLSSARLVKGKLTLVNELFSAQPLVPFCGKVKCCPWSCLESLDKPSTYFSEEPKVALKLVSGSAMRPHPAKATTGGEDAYFIQGTCWVGVADGVGGWASMGVNAGLYSRELMSNCHKISKLQDGVPDPKSVIIKSVGETQALGTCTAVVAAIHEQTLYAANIGDSGFLVIRKGEVLAKSEAMQRDFNFPYQIGHGGDDPSLAQTFEVSVSSGDVLILATDGLFDNLYEREIVDIVQSGHEKGVKSEVVAMWLVKLAHSVGMSTIGRSPFSDAARDAFYEHTGGKLDDVTVVISYID